MKCRVRTFARSLQRSDGWMRAACIFGIWCVATILAPGCETKGTPCYPGDVVACSCPTGAGGVAVCAQDGSSYGACSCSTFPGDAAADVVDGNDAASGVPFGAPCARDSDCATGACFVGGMRSFCSIPCKTPQDCPVPPTDGACNNRGYCKAP